MASEEVAEIWKGACQADLEEFGRFWFLIDDRRAVDPVKTVSPERPSR
jgi:hypothetical protein